MGIFEDYVNRFLGNFWEVYGKIFTRRRRDAEDAEEEKGDSRLNLNTQLAIKIAPAGAG
jgi:hypothetical protein